MDRDIPNIKINNSIIERVKQFDFLGLTIDETLSWKPHVNKVSNKISRIIRIMNKLKNNLPYVVVMFCIMILKNKDLLTYYRIFI